MQQVDHAQLIYYLDYAMTPEGGKPAVIDFVFRLFRPLGYVLDEQYAYKRVDPRSLFAAKTDMQRLVSASSITLRKATT